MNTNNSRIIYLWQQFSARQATRAELDELMELLSSGSHDEESRQYLQQLLAATAAGEEDPARWDPILQSILHPVRTLESYSVGEGGASLAGRGPSRVRRLVRRVMAAAAVVLLLVGLFRLWRTYRAESAVQAPVVVVAPGGNRAVLTLAGFVLTGRSGEKTLNVLSFGARGDGVTLNTSFIQAAIDSATAMGGGVVLVPRGKFLSGTLVLKSNVTLQLREGATILGSINPADYQNLAFILAERQENISITGKGTIDGQGRKVALYLDSLFYAGKLDSSQYNFRRKRPENRPGDLKISDCKNVRINGITVKNACGWVQTYRLCEELVIDSIRVESDAYWNNDGIDIADCKKVRITHCFINSADDGICVKSEDGTDRWNEDIYIADCTVRSSGSAIKFGTSSVGGFKKVRIKNIRVFDTFRSAIALESVDGGDLEDIDIDHIVATNTGDGIFIRLGRRNKNGKTGTLRNVAIRNVKVRIPFDRPDKNYDLRGPDLPFFHNPFPCSITGIPGHPVENVILENIEITFPGRGNDGLAIIPIDRLKDVGESETGYPEFSMFGELPSWGFYVRHVDGLTMKNITVRVAEKDFRPAFVFDDVNKLDLNTITIGKANNNAPVILSHVTHSDIQKVITPGFSGNPVKTIE